MRKQVVLLCSVIKAESSLDLYEVPTFARSVHVLNLRSASARRQAQQSLAPETTHCWASCGEHVNTLASGVHSVLASHLEP